MNSPLRRATIRHPVQLPAGLGALSRRPVRVALEPAEIGSGIRVGRTDIGGEWPVDLEHVVAVPNCTAIGDHNYSVAFVEHLMAALRAASVSDTLILTDGPEIPLYDGSAMVFWDALQQAGRTESGVAWEHLVIREPLKVGEEESFIRGQPAAATRLTYDLEHCHPLVSKQTASFSAEDDFGRDLAPARTFATAEEIRALYGLEPTPEIEQLCVVVYPERVSDPNPSSGSFARHKLLDLMGDLYLCGRTIVGEIHAHRSGHSLNHAFLGALLEQEQAGKS